LKIIDYYRLLKIWQLKEGKASKSMVKLKGRMRVKGNKVKLKKNKYY
jgi:hypothetical protein